ncbi:unnamed protein product [Didymodactylos carnosus]|uniref:Uncharacterized protein n=1 Tax=Didymodactylos carnosus TaxID=1234261 RepID=A0A8S2CW32_9BILA|nr:unnamed protein product [Didymodactylos carnosus]CAF3602126.1 unnamed protein product [Didymodactylos carnosus]
MSKCDFVSCNAEDALEPIAIIGISCTFAGGINSPQSFWDVLVNSVDVGSEIPKERVTDIEAYASPLLIKNPLIKKDLIRRGYFIAHDMLDTFDPSFFGISEGEAAAVDPGHRLLLSKFVHLMEDAGIPIEQIKSSQTAVYIGQFSTDHQVSMFKHSIDTLNRTMQPNVGVYNAASRLSYHFDLHGPCIAMDTACSSSLQTVHLGIQTLRNGEATLVVAGGTNLNYRPETFCAASISTVVSSDGRSRSFSADANGYAKGEGVGLVLLKKLSDAERDGNRIYCVIRDVISNHDGNNQKNSYVVPSPYGQNLLLNEIYSRKHTDRKDIFYIEAHGTGTSVGDPIEANALGKFFNRSQYDPPLLIGSVKSNIGHTEGTAGVAALIKVCLCMKNRLIPPNMNFTKMNPKIRAKDYNLHVVTQCVPFPKTAVTLGINSFGIGGNNAHAVVTEYVKAHHYGPNQNDNTISKQDYIISFSTKSNVSMKKCIETFFAWFLKLPKELVETQSFLAQLCFKLLFERTMTFSHCTSFVFANSNQLKNQLTSYMADETCLGIIETTEPSSLVSTNQKANICFVFSGQGPQWWAMGRELYNSEPVFRQSIDRIDGELSAINKDWSLKKELIDTTDDQSSRINDTNIAQPALFAVQVGLAALWVSWGVYPRVIIGHSAGEIAAAYVGGRLTLKEAVQIAYHRARLQHRNTRQKGRMLAASLSETEARQLLDGIEDRVAVAAINSQQSVTLSGDSDAIEEIHSVLTTLKPNVFKKWLQIENAFHSQQMERFDIQKDLLASLANIKGCPIQSSDVFDMTCSRATIYSTVTGCCINDGKCAFNGDYWWQNVRHAVEFNKTIRAMMNDFKSDQIRIFLEMSPHPVLASSLQECFQSLPVQQQPLILHSLKRKENEQQTLLTSLCHLLPNSIDLKKFWRTRLYSKQNGQLSISSKLDELPLYSFETHTCWLETEESTLNRKITQKQHHPLLGVYSWNNQQPTWNNVLNLDFSQHSYLRDHKVQGNILFPATGFIEVAIAAVRELLSNLSKTNKTNSTITFENIQITSALILKTDELNEIHTVIRMPFKDFFIYSRHRNFTSTDGKTATDTNLYDYSSKNWILHCSGSINIKADVLLSTSYYNIPLIEQDISNNCEWTITSDEEIINLYKCFTNHDYQYGPCFQNIKSISATKSQILASVVMSEQPDYEKYYLHPSLMDSCLQSSLISLSNNDTFVPVSIQRLVVCDKNVLDRQCFAYTTFHLPIRGVTTEETYTADMLIYDKKSGSKPEIIAIFDGIKIQQIPPRDTNKDRSKSIFEKLHETVSVSIQATDNVDLEILMDDYCLKPCWERSDLLYNSTDILPPSDTLLKSICTLIEDGFSESDKEMTANSIDSVNTFVAQYVLLMVKNLLKLNMVKTLSKQSLESLIVGKYHKLLDSCMNLIQSKGYIDDQYNFLSDSTIITKHTIDMYHLQLLKQYPLSSPIISLVSVCGSNLADILTGKLDALQVVFAQENEHLLKQFYSITSDTNTSLTFSALTQYLEQKINEYDKKCRVLKVLEVGGGTGGSTVGILNILLDFANKTNIRIEYTFTDVSPAFFSKARELFANILGEKNKNNLLEITHKQLDIEKLPNDLKLESFDIIFAAQVIHATSNIVNSLTNIRKLLVPSGLVTLVELTRPIPFLDLIFGLLPQWWEFGSDDQIRQDSKRAIMTVDKWAQAFEIVNGFENFVSATSKFGTTTIVVQKSKSLTLLEREQQAWIIFCDEKQKIGEKIAEQLLAEHCYDRKKIILVSNRKIESQFRNIQINNISDDIRTIFHDMNDAHHSLLNILFAWPLDLESLDVGQHLQALGEQEETLCCGSLMHILQASQQYGKEFRPPHVFVLSQNAQPVMCNTSNFDPVQSSIIGFTRSVMVEYPRHCLELIDISSSNVVLISEVVREILSFISSSPTTRQNEEVSLYQNINTHEIERYVPTLKKLKIQKEEKENIHQTRTLIPSDDCESVEFQLDVPQSRFLADLKWKTLTPNRVSLGETQIEVKIHSVGINFRDVLKARGLYPHIRQLGVEYMKQDGNARDEEIGSDFSGTIVGRGANVENSFKIGDKVFGVTISVGAFKSYIVVDQTQISHIPSNFTMEEASGVPTAFLTVMLALEDRARLAQGQSILIHAASGAVGLAAIQYCQMIGANVICTAGTEDKRTFLKEKCGVTHVFNSRDLSFASNVRRIIPNGVDVVLNSLAGVLLQESIKLLAPHGHFIEIGKRDVYSSSKISLFELKSDCSFHVLDLVTYQQSCSQKINHMLKKLVEKFETGTLKPISPLTIFEASQVKDAFAIYNQTINMGKLIVRITSSTKELDIEKQDETIKEGTYSNQRINITMI